MERRDEERHPGHELRFELEARQVPNPKWMPAVQWVGYPLETIGRHGMRRALDALHGFGALLDLLDGCAQPIGTIESVEPDGDVWISLDHGVTSACVTVTDPGATGAMPIPPSGRDIHVAPARGLLGDLVEDHGNGWVSVRGDAAPDDLNRALSEAGPSAAETAPGVGISAPRREVGLDDPAGDDVCADAPGALEYMRRAYPAMRAQREIEQHERAAVRRDLGEGLEDGASGFESLRAPSPPSGMACAWPSCRDRCKVQGDCAGAAVKD